MNGWIKVWESSPENGQDCWIAVRNRIKKHDVFKGEFKDGVFRNEHGYPLKLAEYWMPLRAEGE
jgi:hypothetical protein